jgi:threonine dehydrogenase-like Zn-dependent dehydrogenase
MKAGVYVSPGKLGIKDVPDPVLERGEVLVRVKAAGICGSDMNAYRDRSRFRGVEGRVLGHELAGDIVAVGEGVEDREVGQRVGIEPLVGCTRCERCLTGDYHLCPELKHIGFAWSGGFAELSKAPAEKAYPLPDNVSYEAAAILDCLACGVHAIHRLDIGVPDSVVVLGGGAIGLSVLSCAKWAGARFVALSDPLSDAREIADKAGADLTIDPGQDDPVERVMDATGGKGADVVVEAVGGRAPTFEQGMQMVKRGGRLGYQGFFSEPQAVDTRKLLTSEITIVPIFSYARWGTATEYQIALDGVSQGRLIADAMVTHRFPLEEIDDAFKAAADKDTSRAVKVIVNP